MAGKGAPIGNDNATRNKPWADALKRALARYATKDVEPGQAMNKLAERVVADAIAGNKDAWQEIGNRLDGKPHQTIAAEVDASVTVEIVKYGDAKTD